jgi:DNA-binding transcriptional MerR regulator
MQVQPSAPDAYSIGQLSRTFNTSRRALRYYEAKGLLAPARDGPYRIYGRREFQRVRVIVEARRVGLTIAQIHDLLEQYEPTDHGDAQTLKAIGYLNRRLSRLEAEAQSVKVKIAELEAQLSGPNQPPVVS